MHDVQSRGMRFSLLAAGFIASMFALVGSCFLNYRYGHALARTPEDGTIFGVLAIASDVFMAASLFYLFEAKKRRQWAQVVAALIVWIATTAFAGIAAISQASMSRIDAVAHRQTTATTYSDTRTELTEARAQRKGLGNWSRAETAIRSEIEKHKIRREWIASSECTEISGKGQREYCANYQTLIGELGSTQQANKLDKRIEELVAKSDKMASSNVAVASEADPAAATLAGATGYSQRSVQSAIVFGFATLILTLCSLGPYITSSMLSVDDRPRVIDAEATDITPLVDAKLEEAKPLAIAAPPKPKGAKVETVPPTDPGPEWRALLVSLGFPGDGWQPPRDKRGDFVLREKDHPQVAAWRFFCYAQATGFLGEFTPEQIDEAISRVAKCDFRVETGSRVVKPELEAIKRWVRKEGPPVRWVLKPAPIDAVKAMLVNRKILPETALATVPATVEETTATPATASPEATEEPKPNGIKAVALRRFFRGADQTPENDGTLLN